MYMMEECVPPKPIRGGQDENTKAEEKEYEVTGTHSLHGLYNQGATCYLNSVLQVLSMTTEIHDRLDPQYQTDHALKNIFEGLKEDVCGTETIRTEFGIDNDYVQRDAAEYLELILSSISPEASKVFQGELIYTTECSEGHSIIEETNSFWTLPLSLEDAHKSNNSVELLPSFERIFETELYNVGNKMFCNECKNKTEASRGCEMATFPQVLTLLLKRFDFDYYTRSHVKSHCCVEVPRALQRENKTYKLYGMVNHVGSLRGGHYTATIWSKEEETWYEFNDTHVNKVKEQPFAGKSETYSSRTVYLLMYRECEEPLKNNAQAVTNTIEEEKGVDFGLEEMEGDEVGHEGIVSERDNSFMGEENISQTETDEQRQTDLQDPLQTNSGYMAETMNEQICGDFVLEEMKEDKVGGRNADPEENPQMGHRGEEEDQEHVENGESVGERIGEDCGMQSQLINSAETQEELSMSGDRTFSSITPENSNSGLKSEKLNERDVDDVTVNVGEDWSCKQCLDEEPEKQRECQEPVETNSDELTDTMKEQQGEDVLPEEMKGDIDDEENMQMGHGEEDEGEKLIDRTHGQTQENLSINGDSTLSSITQEKEDEETEKQNQRDTKGYEHVETNSGDMTNEVSEDKQDAAQRWWCFLWCLNLQRFCNKVSEEPTVTYSPGRTDDEDEAGEKDTGDEEKRPMMTQ